MALRLLILILFTLLLLDCGGCLIGPVDVQRKLPDTLTAEAVGVVGVSDGVLTLSDGRKVRLAGIRTEGISQAELSALDERLGSMELGACLVQELPGGLAYVVQTNHHWPFHIQEAFPPWYPPLIGIPYYEDKRPVRSDVALELIRSGIAQPRPEDLRTVRPLALDGKTPPTVNQLQEAYIAAGQKHARPDQSRTGAAPASQTARRSSPPVGSGFSRRCRDGVCCTYLHPAMNRRTNPNRRSATGSGAERIRSRSISPVRVSCAGPPPP